MNRDLENVKEAKESFDRILNNEKYANIIKDDNHLSLLLGLVEDGSYRRILDIGTGTGYLAFPLADKFPKASVYGIDVAETIIANNNAIVEANGISNLTFQSFDGLSYPFADESFDLIVTRYAFHHFPNVTAAIQQMNRLLVSGGKVLVSDPMKNIKDSNSIIDIFMKVKKDGHIQFYSSTELDELFSNNGFIKDEQIITSMNFPFAPKNKYLEIYDSITDEDKLLYDIRACNGIVWVKHIDVGNTVFLKK